MQLGMLPYSESLAFNQIYPIRRIFNHTLALHPDLDIALVNMANTLKDTVSLDGQLYMLINGSRHAGPVRRSSSILSARYLGELEFH